MTDIARPEEEHRFPCDNCGSDMRYNPGAGQLVCDHCGNTEPLDDAPSGDPWRTVPAIEELDFQSAIRDQLPRAEMEETRVSRCPNCGAQVEFEPDVHAAECPFCATPVVTDTGVHRHIKPAGVIPFQLPERDAQKAMSKWLGRLWFAPSGLKEYARKGRKMEGIYVPYWTYDAQTASSYTGQRGTVYTVTVRGPDGKPRQEQKVRWTPVSGRVSRFFDDVLVLASRSLPKRFTDALAPWGLGALAPYAPQYLAGFRAEAYQVELEEGMTEARAIMDAQIAADVRRDIGGDLQRVNRVDTRLSDVTFKHVLLPVWLAAYKYNGKSYRFVVNGQTGKVQGERPYSAIKIAIAVIVAALVIGIALYLYAVYGEGGGSLGSTFPTGGGSFPSTGTGGSLFK
ncbi:primosomal protein N' (replication factor Y) - superfamily II helicase [Rhodobacterales bacterium HKCCE2091]|nr:primosomal protein N' (replication factor Y) - superfamily II helicase [Rhodobacterales bacterium HKCCE2091]